MAGVAVSRLNAQGATVAIAGKPTCTTCTIELVKVATVGTADDLVLMGELSHIGRGPGNTFVAPSIDGTQLLQFDSTGRYLRAVGRRGQGPGEFAGGLRVDGRGRGDSLYVHSRRTISVFSPALEFGRSFAMPPEPASGLVPLPNGNVVYVAAPTTAVVAAERSILKLLGPQGEPIGRFGMPGSDQPDICVTCFSRAVSVALDRQGVVIAHPNRYVIERHDLAGRLQASVTITDSPWMQAWTTDLVSAAQYTQRPRPRITRAISMGGSRIWVLAQVAGRDWIAPGPPTGEGALRIGGVTGMRANSEASRLMLEKTAKNVATVVELIDLERRQVIASQTFDPGNYVHLDGDLVQIRRLNADGVITFDVYRLQLRER
jgi:hypothetical protein